MENNKNFDDWNKKKKITDAEECRPYIVREIWWCSLGLNIGYEQNGYGEEFLRPVVIIRGLGASICVAVPLTTSVSKHPLRVPVGIVQEKEAVALVSQLRVIDTRRLVEKIGFLDKDIFEQIRKTARSLF